MDEKTQVGKTLVVTATHNGGRGGEAYPVLAQSLAGVTKVVATIPAGVLTTMVSVALGVTIPTSTDYEFARFDVRVTLRVEYSKQDAALAWLHGAADSILQREKRAIMRDSQEVKPIPPMPDGVYYGILTLGIGRTEVSEARYMGKTVHGRGDCSLEHPFMPDIDSMLGVLGELQTKVLQNAVRAVRAARGARKGDAPLETVGRAAA